MGRTLPGANFQPSAGSLKSNNVKMKKELIAVTIWTGVFCSFSLVENRWIFHRDRMRSAFASAIRLCKRPSRILTVSGDDQSRKYVGFP